MKKKNDHSPLNMEDPVDAAEDFESVDSQHSLNVKLDFYLQIGMESHLFSIYKSATGIKKKSLSVLPVGMLICVQRVENQT